MTKAVCMSYNEKAKNRQKLEEEKTIKMASHTVTESTVNDDEAN